MLLDSEKFGRTALLTYAQIADFDAIVTERMPAPEYERACREAGTELIISRNAHGTRPTAARVDACGAWRAQAGMPAAARVRRAPGGFARPAPIADLRFWQKWSTIIVQC